MTAISLNLPTAKSSDAPGLALEGLPKLDPGGTLPQAFADLLGKAGKASTSADEAASSASAGEDAVDADGSAADTSSGTDVEISLATKAATEGAAQAAGEAAGGKVLPGEGTKLAAKATNEDAAGQPAEGTPESGDVSQAEQARQAAEAQGLLAPIAIAATTDGKPIASSPAVAEQAAKVVSPFRAAGGNAAGTQAAVQVSIQSDGQPGTGSQDLSGGDTGRRGDAQAEQAARVAARRIGAGSGTAASTKGEANQTGLSLQLRAADKPFAMPDASQAGSLGSSVSTGTSAATGIATTLPGAPALGSAIGSTGQAGAMPHFPELAALVDRIAAARDSAGSASATVALAHKELGNLSLTFETSGRSLNVEVAAQDSETQRSLAAAIAADRPQFRGGEGQQQANTQGQAQTSLGANAQGGEAGARQSGEAGDDRSDRRDAPRQDGTAQSGAPGQSPTDPKSDGGIYA